MRLLGGTWVAPRWNLGGMNLNWFHSFIPENRLVTFYNELLSKPLAVLKPILEFLQLRYFIFPLKMFLGASWELFGRLLGGTWVAPGRNLEGTWEDLGRRESELVPFI